jgi:isoleucyl-tRNA synthetase
MKDATEGKDFNFPGEEEAILQFWKETDAFKKQLSLTSGKKEYVFYDGPPFATGLPHYGHILAGTLKVRACVSLSTLQDRNEVVCGLHVK